MRTKTLICAAALLAAGVATSMAQSNVYSLNVVGYVNVNIVGLGNYSMVANPLNNANNGITNIFPGSSMTDGANILRWDPVAADFRATVYSYSTFLGKWDGNFNLNPGEGIFFVNNDARTITNTFVGDVIQGSYTNNLLGAGDYNAVGSSAPLGGNFTNSIAGLPPADGDVVQRWDVATQDLSTQTPSYSTFFNAWQPPLNVNIAVGEGFFYIRNGGNVSWVRNFTVQ
jgi:ribosomal protein L24E